ncbi:hypothetical protein ACJJTC_019132 [Scirpophaga incertulas]
MRKSLSHDDIRCESSYRTEGFFLLLSTTHVRALVEINRKQPKPKKIALSTASVMLIAVLLMLILNTSNAYEVTKNKCYMDAGKNKCYWLDPQKSAHTACASCPRTDRQEHIIVGSNGFGKEWANLIYINATTGKVNTDSSIGRLAPAVEGTLLWELVDIVNIVSKEGSLKRIRQHEASLSTMAMQIEKVRDEYRVEIDEHVTNAEMHIHELKFRLERSESENENRVSEINELVSKLNKTSHEVIKINEHVIKQSVVSQNYIAENKKLRNEIASLTTKMDKMEDEMAQLIMDAVSAMLHKKSSYSDLEAHVDYGVAAATMPPLLRNRRQEDEGLALDASSSGTDVKPNINDNAYPSDKDVKPDISDNTVLKIRYGFVDIGLEQHVVKNCSCTNGVMKLCNIEIKFNSTRAYKPDESTYCLLDVSTSNGVMTRKERLSCKQSDIKDACSLSLVVGQSIDMSNVSIVRIGDGYVYLDEERLLFKSKVTKDMCEYAEEDRPYHLKPTSKYRPIFIMCNIASKDDIPDRLNNRLHYLVVVLALIVTIIIETVYQSWVVGLEVFTAAIVGLLVVIEDALVSASMQLRNYAALVVLVGCFGAITTSRLVGASLWVLMLGWLYTVEAIDGMTFTVNGVKGTNKVTYETSLNMHAGDTLVMGNVSLSLLEIRQRREYDYVYSLPTVITMSALCRQWDCTNTAPNCINKCDGYCGELSYVRCAPMQMYHSSMQPLRLT